MRLNLMYLLIAAMFLLVGKIDIQLAKLWYSVSGLNMGIFILEIINGMIHHEEDYFQDN